MTGNREMTMLIVGDVFVRRDDPPSVFQHVKKLLRAADFTLGIRCRIRDRKLHAVEFLPARCDPDLNPGALELEQGRDVVDLVRERSAQFGTEFVARGDAMQVVTDVVRAVTPRAA